MTAGFRVLLLLATVASGTAIGVAQTPNPPATLPAAARPPYSGPVRGAQSKRWEPWSAMRSAITPILGWKLGIDAGSFAQLDFDQALVRIDALGVGYVEASDRQKLDMEIPKYITYKLQPGEVNAIKDKLIAFNLTLVAYRVSTIEPSEEARRKLFDFAKSLNIETIVSEQIPADLEPIDKLANDYGINVAIGGSMQVALAAVNGRSKRIGLSVDTGSWLGEGLKPVEALKQAKDRLLVIHLGDRNAFATRDLLREMYQQDIKPSLITVSPGGVDEFEEAVTGKYSLRKQVLVQPKPRQAGELDDSRDADV